MEEIFLDDEMAKIKWGNMVDKKQARCYYNTRR